MYLNEDDGEVYLYDGDVTVKNIYTKKEIIAYAINKKLLIITKENIHLYYELMSDEDKFNYSKHINRKNIELVYLLLNNDLKKHHFDNIDVMFSMRKAKLVKEFGTDYKIICKSELFKAKDHFILSEDGYFNTALKAFEIKDTLKPIKEYIEEIKESFGYKEYLYLTSNKKEYIAYSYNPFKCFASDGDIFLKDEKININFWGKNWRYKTTFKSSKKINRICADYGLGTTKENFLIKN